MRIMNPPPIKELSTPISSTIIERMVERINMARAYERIFIHRTAKSQNTSAKRKH